jgi:acyl carrier protein
VGADDDFLALGGDSLLAAQLISRVRECLGAELPVRTLYETLAPVGVAFAFQLNAGRLDSSER